MRSSGGGSRRVSSELLNFKTERFSNNDKETPETQSEDNHVRDRAHFSHVTIA